MNENMNVESFTSAELTHLHNALVTALIHSKKHLSTWIEISEKNPSVAAFIKRLSK